VYTYALRSLSSPLVTTATGAAVCDEEFVPVYTYALRSLSSPLVAGG
jgi:hypothetical protein